MRQILLLLFTCFALSAFAQQSETYIKIAKQLKPSDTLEIKEVFGNGKLKDSGTAYIYDFGEFYYRSTVGTFSQFDKKGTKIVESKFDDYGNYLSYILYDVDGHVLRSVITRSIEITSEDPLDILKGKNLQILTDERVYRYSDKLCKHVLLKEGQRLNDKKIGTWTTYNEDGTVKKEKEF